MNKEKTLRGLGRRKTAVAQVVLTSAPDKRMINEVTVEEYFPTIALRNVALRPLTVTSQEDTFGLAAKISGGGKASQAEALTLALARALITTDSGFRKQLKKAGYLTRDPRMKERKKPGLRRARRARQFSKR
ncbi:MAG: 30S ribosomal protein S9 [Acidobacteriota bacterium]